MCLPVGLYYDGYAYYIMHRPQIRQHSRLTVPVLELVPHSGQTGDSGYRTRNDCLSAGLLYLITFLSPFIREVHIIRNHKRYQADEQSRADSQTAKGTRYLIR